MIGLDANNDGLTDVFVASDMTRNQLWINQGNLRFIDEAMLLGCAVDEHGVPKSGMGVAATDPDNDGDTDILVMNLASQTDSFFRNTGSYFEDATVDVGLAIGDVNKDGGLDLLIVNRDGPVNLLINQVAGHGNWASFQLRTGKGRDALGATLSANVGKLRINRQVQAAGSYLTASDPRIILGLADHNSANDVAVRWPNGTTESFGNFSANDTIVLTQGKGQTIP